MISIVIPAYNEESVLSKCKVANHFTNKLNKN